MLLSYFKVTKDDGIRGNTSMETLAKLKPAFQAGGSTTAGKKLLHQCSSVFSNQDGILIKPSTLSSIYTHFNTLKKKALGKHCGKR